MALSFLSSDYHLSLRGCGYVSPARSNKHMQPQPCHFCRDGLLPWRHRRSFQRDSSDCWTLGLFPGGQNVNATHMDFLCQFRSNLNKHRQTTDTFRYEHRTENPIHCHFPEKQLPFRKDLSMKVTHTSYCNILKEVF